MKPIIVGRICRTNSPDWLQKPLARWALFVYAVGLGSVISRKVLVVITLGRKTGKKRNAALLYVEEEGLLFCCSRRGARSHWLRNLETNPYGWVRVGGSTWQTRGEIIENPRERGRILAKFQSKYGVAATVLLKKDRVTVVAFADHES